MYSLNRFIVINFFTSFHILFLALTYNQFTISGNACQVLFCKILFIDLTSIFPHLAFYSLIIPLANNVVKNKFYFYIYVGDKRKRKGVYPLSLPYNNIFRIMKFYNIFLIHLIKFIGAFFLIFYSVSY